MTEHNHPVFEFVDDTTRRLAQLVAIAQDLTVTIVTCRKLGELLDDPEVDDDTRRSLWLTALIHYARAFSAAEAIDLGVEVLMAELQGDPLGAHRQYLTLLQRQTQPVDDPLQRVRVGLVIGTDDAGKPGEVLGTGVYFMESRPANKEIVEQLEMLSGAVHDRIMQLGQEAEQAVLAAARQHPLDELLRMPRFDPAVAGG